MARRRPKEKKASMEACKRSAPPVRQRSIRVDVRPRRGDSYTIRLGHGMVEGIARSLAARSAPTRYTVVTDDRVAALHGAKLLAALNRHGIHPGLFVFPAGERSKSMRTAMALAERLLELGMDRTSALIAFGGGVVGDLTGYVASTYMRGIPHIQIPTTLLAQVDSSIGGKTAVNLRQGKNLLGTFHQPESVFIDTRFLETLAPGDYRNGLAEIVKYGIIEGGTAFQRIEGNVGALLAGDRAFLQDIIALACRIKRRIVAMDERETGLRRVLNFGHTLGHAVEQVSHYRIPHGRAIAIGMIAAAKISCRWSGLPEKEGERILRLIARLGLACAIPRSLETAALRECLKRDKKSEGGHLRMVLLQKIGSPVIRDDVPWPLIQRTIAGLHGERAGRRTGAAQAEGGS